MKKPIFSLGALLFSLALITAMFSPMTLQAQEPVSDAPHTALYEVTASNESSTYTWFTTDFSQSFTYQVATGSEITVDILDPSDPQTDLNIQLGNLTRLAVPDVTADGNLGLGYWNLTGVFGFVSQTNWMDIETQLLQQSFTDLSINETTTTILGESRDLIIISFQDNFQATELHYDTSTGLLYAAFVEIGNFVLDFSIQEYVPGPTLNPAEDNSITYLITDTNESATYTWFNHDFSQSFPYEVASGSLMYAAFADPTEINPTLDLQLGNLTRTGIMDTEVDSNLGIGYWNLSNVFGLIANTSWTEVEELMSAQSFNNFDLQTGLSLQVGQDTISTVAVTFADNFQSTSLVYAEESGILLSAEVEIGNFVLAFEVASTTLDLTTEEISSSMQSSSQNTQSSEPSTSSSSTSSSSTSSSQDDSSSSSETVGYNMLVGVSIVFVATIFLRKRSGNSFQ